jgi:thiosulfate/3-mercaptopyruvate sulfurtransferase
MDAHRPDPLLAAADLQAIAPYARLLDVRYVLGRTDGHAQYLAGHVPGAVYVDLDVDLTDPVGDGSRGRHPLPDLERFAAAMRRSGVSRDQTVVVYDDWTGAAATRAWWLLTYCGHPDVRVLDGGWAGYLATGGPVDAGDVVPPPGDFRADPGHLPVLDADGAARLAKDGVLVDVRAAERYRGETEPLDPVAGHIPGAVNLPFTEVNLATSAGGTTVFRVRDEAMGRYERAGVRADREVGVYCGSGVTATHTVFALRRLGLTAALYPGSWSEWVADPGRPVATGDTPAA